MLRIGGRDFDLMWAVKRAGVLRKMERSCDVSALAGRDRRDRFPSAPKNESALMLVLPPAE